MKRKWFRDDDGTYYRTVPLITAELGRCAWRPWRLRALRAEWDEAWREGLIRKPRLGRGDVLVPPLPMRVAYPHMPGLWVLDGES